MRYISTRGAWANDPQPFRAILLEGLAPDGGLAVPERYPRFSAAEFEALLMPGKIFKNHQTFKKRHIGRQFAPRVDLL